MDFSGGNRVSMGRGGRPPMIEKEKCAQCGICVGACPTSALREDEKGYPVADFRTCNGCGACFEVCPVGAIR